jgi:GNAT superfamily N-acetyltransferase
VTEVDEVLVCLRGLLAEVPVVPLPDGFALRAMDEDDPDDVARWLEVHNAAFGRAWTVENHRLAMRENPVARVDRTYLVEQEGRAVGTGSIARYRANPEVGLGHYMAVHPDVRGRGLATALCSYRYGALAGMGLEVAEAQTHLHRTGSLRAHFRCGFVPKEGLDPWNSARPTSGPLREEADRRLREEFAAWRAEG